MAAQDSTGQSSPRPLPCSPQFSLPYRQVNEGLDPRCSIRAATQMIYSILRGWFGTVSELILRNSFNFNISRMIEKPKLVFNLHETTPFSTHRIIIQEKLNSTNLTIHTCVNVSNIYIIFKVLEHLVYNMAFKFLSTQQRLLTTFLSTTFKRPCAEKQRENTESSFHLIAFDLNIS